MYCVHLYRQKVREIHANMNIPDSYICNRQSKVSILPFCWIGILPSLRIWGSAAVATTFDRRQVAIPGPNVESGICLPHMYKQEPPAPVHQLRNEGSGPH